MLFLWETGHWLDSGEKKRKGTGGRGKSNVALDCNSKDRRLQTKLLLLRFEDDEHSDYWVCRKQQLPRTRIHADYVRNRTLILSPANFYFFSCFILIIYENFIKLRLSPQLKNWLRKKRIKLQLRKTIQMRKWLKQKNIEKDKETTNLPPKKNIPKTCLCKRRSIVTGEEHIMFPFCTISQSIFKKQCICIL